MPWRSQASRTGARRRREFFYLHTMTKFKKQLREFNPTKYLLNEELIIQAVWECLKANAPEEALEILETHFSAKNKNSTPLPQSRRAFFGTA